MDGKSANDFQFWLFDFGGIFMILLVFAHITSFHFLFFYVEQWEYFAIHTFGTQFYFLCVNHSIDYIFSLFCVIMRVLPKTIQMKRHIYFDVFFTSFHLFFFPSIPQIFTPNQLCLLFKCAYCSKFAGSKCPK